MTLQPTRNDVGRQHTLRLRLKPKARRSGFVDGAWWPRSGDLADELPDLLAVLSVRLGPIDRVLYHPNEWACLPAELATGGRAVHLDGLQGQPSDTVEVLGLNHNRIALLVVPPYTEPDQAHTTMMAAAEPNHASTVDDLAVINARGREARAHAYAALQRWESDGGKN